MKLFDLGIDDVLRSSLTKLLWLVLVGWAAYTFFRQHTGKGFWIGYGVASGLALLVMTTKTNPVNGDKVFESDVDGDGKGGTLNDAVLSGNNGVIGGGVNDIVFW